MSQEQLRCSDGTALRSTLWKPEGQGPWPSLLMRQPYGRAIASTVTYAHPSWYARRGFAVLVQDARGRGDSEGEFLGFQQEASDTTATLRWIRQQPWCNGKVGTYGFSYQGLSQLLLSGSEHLPDALAPAMCGLDERLHWASEGAVIGGPWAWAGRCSLPPNAASGRGIIKAGRRSAAASRADPSCAKAGTCWSASTPQAWGCAG